MSEFEVREGRIPENTAVVSIESNQVSVQRCHEEAVAEHSKAAVHNVSTAIRQPGRQLSFVLPDLLSGSSIDGPRPIVRTCNEQDAVHKQRRRLEPAAARHTRRLERPLNRKFADILRRDLLQRAVPAAGVVARIGEPTRCVLEAIAQIPERHLV